jgi:hypothetical protein
MKEMPLSLPAIWRLAQTHQIQRGLQLPCGYAGQSWLSFPEHVFIEKFGLQLPIAVFRQHRQHVLRLDSITNVTSAC